MATAKKEEKKANTGCASSGHITKLKQSIFAFRYLWVRFIFSMINYGVNHLTILDPLVINS